VTASTQEIAGGRALFGGLAGLRDSEQWLGRAMIAPAIIYIVLLVGFPFVLALIYSVTNVTVGSVDVKFVGLRNFQAIMENPAFWQALRNTIFFTIVSQVIVLVLAKVLAMALMKDFRGKWLVRLLILLPWVAPVSLGAIGWLWIFDSIAEIRLKKPE
jgi:multiple sugar transport system permease protein